MCNNREHFYRGFLSKSKQYEKDADIVCDVDDTVIKSLWLEGVPIGNRHSVSETFKLCFPHL